MKSRFTGTLPALVVATLLCGGTGPVFAQPANPADAPADADPPADGAPADGAPADAAPAADGSAAWPARGGRMAPSPQVAGDGGFYRGNSPNDPVAGFYLGVGYMTVLVILFAAWVRGTGWAGVDARRLSVRAAFWQPILILSGFVAFLLAFTSPYSLMGTAIVLVGYVTPFALYVRERNARVPEELKVFTKAHLYRCWLQFLARFGYAPPMEEGPVPIMGAPIRFIGKSGDQRGEADRTSQVENSQGFLIAKQLVYEAIQDRGTDLHLEPKDDELSIRVRIDGVMYPRPALEKPVGEALLNILKVLGGMDITERRRPQDGSFRAETEGREIDFRVATQGTRHGEKLSLRILDQSSSVSSLRDLGLRTEVREGLERTINLPHGMLLVCGPTGAGKSTTLYSCLNGIDTGQRNVITVEDPVEYKIDGVNQIEINQKADQTFAASLRSILRQDPDVVMIGEIRDHETGEIACQAANTGHLVFSTIHANDSFTALFRLIELGIEPYVVANSVSAILAQRLARRLATEHREAYEPDYATLARLGIDLEPGAVLYRAPQSNGKPKRGSTEGILPEIIPFKGRIGVFEFLEITSRIADLVRDKASIGAIRAEARREGMRSMREEGLRLVARGITSMEELVRVAK